jgi:hypothetical protein
MSKFEVIDHTEHRWQYRYKLHGRENGASTYSKEIVEYHVPLWSQYTRGLDVVLSSCPRMINMDVSGDLAVQYFHEYTYKNPLENAELVQRALSNRFERIIYVVSYKSLAAQMSANGYESWFVPMAIDTERIQVPQRLPSKGDRVAAYFGNLVDRKAVIFRSLNKTFKEHGWTLDHITGPQSKSWQDLTQYQYGVGVGRCAQEMMHLGLKVMIAGSEFGGIITNEAEWLAQRDTNFNGRVITFDRDPVACINSWEHSISHRVYDVHDALTELESHLRNLYT